MVVGASGETSSVESRVLLSPADRVVATSTVIIDQDAVIVHATATVEAEWAAGGARAEVTLLTNGWPGVPDWLDEITMEINTWKN